MNKQRFYGILLAIAGILMFSSKAVMVKLAYQYEVDTVSLLLLRMVFALPFYLVISFFGKPKQEVKKGDIVWVFFLGFIGYYLASYFDFLGLQYVKAGLERLILFVYPTLVLLISYIFLKKKITREQAMGVAITYTGVIVIFASELQINQESGVILGSLLIFLSALTYAGYLVGSGWIIPKFGPRLFTSYAMIVSCFAVIVHYVVLGDFDILSLHPNVYWIGLAMAVFATVIPSYLISYAIKSLGANNFSLFGSLGPVSTIVLAYFFLGEILTLTQVVGGLVIIFGIFIAERKKQI
mgnify:CR=1 FL=1